GADVRLLRADRDADPLRRPRSGRVVHGADGVVRDSEGRRGGVVQVVEDAAPRGGDVVVRDRGGRAGVGQGEVAGLDADAHVVHRVLDDAGVEVVLDEDAEAVAEAAATEVLDQVVRDQVVGGGADGVEVVEVDAGVGRVLDDVVLDRDVVGQIEGRDA